MARSNGTTSTIERNEPEVNLKEDVAIKIKRLERVVFEVPIRGTSPLIVNRWSEKAKQMMLDAQQSKTRTKKDPKDPHALFMASRYRLNPAAVGARGGQRQQAATAKARTKVEDLDGFPATGFKAAIVHAARLFDGITIVMLKQTVLVVGYGPEQLVPIDYEELTMREDTPRNANGVADLRYRAQYWPWSATLRVRVIAGQLDLPSVFALVDAAGIGGVGEWRPTAPKSATGTFGTFEVIE